MAVSNAQIDGLQVGDIIEITISEAPDATRTIRGPVHAYYDGHKAVGGQSLVSGGDFRPREYFGKFIDSLVVIEKAKPNFYANVDREPVVGDIYRQGIFGGIYNIIVKDFPTRSFAGLSPIGLDFALTDAARRERLRTLVWDGNKRQPVQ